MALLSYTLKKNYVQRKLMKDHITSYNPEELQRNNTSDCVNLKGDKLC